MNRLKLFFLMTISILATISSDIFSTNRSVKKASDALFNVLMTIDLIRPDNLGFRIEKVRSKFYKFKKTDWFEVLHTKNKNHGKSLMVYIDELMITVDCGCHYKDPNTLCSSDLCNMIRYAKHRFETLERLGF